MIPGSVSKLSETTVASATTITAKSDIVIVTGTTAIATIVPAIGTNFCSFLVLIATNAAGVVVGTGGNVLVGTTLVQNRAYTLVYVKSLAKWVIQGVV